MINRALLALSALSVLVLGMSSRPAAVEPARTATFARDIAPILQRSCQSCHRPGSVAPMSLITYEDVRPWARSIKQRTGLRNRMGVMPPWFIEKHIGIQAYKDDISLSDQEIATIAAWADAGAPQGNPADAPRPLVFTAASAWDMGQPDLILDSPLYTMKAGMPDWWGSFPPSPTGLKEDRYVAAVEFKETSDVKDGVGGKFIFHHAVHAIRQGDGGFGSIGGPHEVGRNAERFEPDAGRLLTAGSSFLWNSMHMHANPTRDITARLSVGYRFHPKGYKPARRTGNVTLGNAEIDLLPLTAGQVIHAYATLQEHTLLSTFEPHMHAAGVRMCLDAIFGGRTDTLTCAGYDHNWVKVYKYTDDAAPLLPKGTILHMTAYFDNTAANRNVVDPRNWGGLGHRSIDNMALMIMPIVVLDDSEFKEAMAKRRTTLRLTPGQMVLGCPLCGYDELPAFGPSRPRTQARTEAAQ